MVQESRYELKYTLSRSDQQTLDRMLLMHPAGFDRLYPDRYVNNIYFDDFEFNACQFNLAGISDRVKYRYRWYGQEGEWVSGKLELKIKNNNLGRKEYRDVRKASSLEETLELMTEGFTTKGMHPTLQNRYLRSYFIDRSGRFRLTVDRFINYVLFFSKSEKLNKEAHSFEDNRVVVEVKFDKSHADAFDIISADLPFRLTKHSKYVTGLLSLAY